MGQYDTDTSLSDIAAEERIDSRDLFDLMSELETERDSAEEDPETHGEGWDEDKADLLKALNELQRETEGYSGDKWSDGVFFVAEEDFQTYAQELAEDIGITDIMVVWPLYCIDWTKAVRELKMDYTSCRIDGSEFWYR